MSPFGYNGVPETKIYWVHNVEIVYLHSYQFREFFSSPKRKLHRSFKGLLYNQWDLWRHYCFTMPMYTLVAQNLISNLVLTGMIVGKSSPLFICNVLLFKLIRFLRTQFKKIYKHYLGSWTGRTVVIDFVLFDKAFKYF